MDINRHPGDAIHGPAESFIGDVWLWPRIGTTEHTEVRNVLFTPGSRSAWHTHHGGQVLHVTEGVGVVQCRGGERQEIRAGDTVILKPGEQHWHGAGPATFMTHIAVTDGAVDWHEHVETDD